ncbi:hypothetical protein PMAYCL1PPCAC_33444, partial [Pristionchus mayeri]
ILCSDNLICEVNCKSTGVVAARNTGKYLALLLLESIFGLIVAFSNLLLILILIVGRRRLMKNNFYVVLANLVVCTSLKAGVELGFIVPYYVLQSDGEKKVVADHHCVQAKGYFSGPYELLIFNVSVCADYGVLFFSVLIAINRFLAVTKPPEDSRSVRHPGLKTGLSCVLVWLCSMIIPIPFFIFDCQYFYDNKLQVYYNTCSNFDNDLSIALLKCLIYLSYLCALVVLLLYLLILRSLRKQRRSMNSPSRQTSNAQLQLLKQSIVVFALYGASILCVFAMSFVRPGFIMGAFDIAYVENLLNLSIAAVYPICFLALSGEMRRLQMR